MNLTLNQQKNPFLETPLLAIVTARSVLNDFMSGKIPIFVNEFHQKACKDGDKPSNTPDWHDPPPCPRSEKVASEASEPDAYASQQLMS